MGIVELMSYVHQKTGILDAFTHISPTEEKSAVIYDDLIACILGNGSNYGLYKMANISDRSVGKLRSVEDSYLRMETLVNSNDHISDSIQASMDKSLNAVLILLRRAILQKISLKAKAYRH